MKDENISQSARKHKTKQQMANNLISPRKTLLEQFYEKGFLNLPKSKFSAAERLQCGKRLINSYQIMQKANLHSGFIFNNRIDLALSLESKMYSDALNFYRRCLRAVPAEFWQVVRSVCLEEKLPQLPDSISERQRSHINFLLHIDLCRGLDRILSSQLKVDSSEK